mmetsp:Transcript_826/g.2551  ORF Transcript_826/g.2551 Transcript_826/m.2551 type:complete len:288 (-) Transcript_826:1316-2179(-)
MVLKEHRNLLVHTVDPLLPLAVHVQDLKEGLVDALIVSKPLLDLVHIIDRLVEFDRLLLLLILLAQLRSLLLLCLVLADFNLVPIRNKGVEAEQQVLVALKQGLDELHNAVRVDLVHPELLHDVKELVVYAGLVLKPFLHLGQVLNGVLLGELLLGALAALGWALSRHLPPGLCHLLDLLCFGILIQRLGLLLSLGLSQRVGCLHLGLGRLHHHLLGDQEPLRHLHWHTLQRGRHAHVLDLDIGGLHFPLGHRRSYALGLLLLGSLHSLGLCLCLGLRGLHPQHLVE